MYNFVSICVMLIIIFLRVREMRRCNMHAVQYMQEQLQNAVRRSVVFGLVAFEIIDIITN